MSITMSYPNAAFKLRPCYTGQIWKCNNHRSFWICVWEKTQHGNRMIILLLSFSKSFVFKMLPSTPKPKAGVFKFLQIESVFENLRFRKKLMCTVGQAIEIKLQFQIHSAQCGWCPRHAEESVFIGWQTALRSRTIDSMILFVEVLPMMKAGRSKNAPFWHHWDGGGVVQMFHLFCPRLQSWTE